MYSVILAGGSGTRLFPLSRSEYPKQFIPLLDKESLFQKAVLRACLYSMPDEIYVVTNEAHKFLVRDQLEEMDADCHILTEPCGKNTLPAIQYAVSEIAKRDPDAVVAVFASDQLIKADGNYTRAIDQACVLAKTHLVVFGIVPTSPHTGYGYIRPGASLEEGYVVDAFVEKPDAPTAERYLAEKYLWNAGMFCFGVPLFLEECKKLSPEVYTAFQKPANEAYDLTPKISMDYGIMEKTDKAAVVPLTSSWSDLGSFEALYSVMDKDILGNVVEGEYLSPDGRNNLIISDKLVATLGLSDVAVIDTPDVLLVCPKNQSQQVGEITALLQKNDDGRASVHTTVHRPWGSYSVLLKGKAYLIKRLTVKPHARLSLQYHHHRSEHWIVVSGMAEVVNGDATCFVRNGESTFVPAGTVHRLSNPGILPLEVIEVQLGEILTEEDIVRCEDDYLRKK
ncbi:Alginate biosynthesis protein AlgA [Methanocorpusculaceae archaeon Sp1]|nr:Alginate biosynthesis protein AlgA [Methanocorpusculaceae archaeon Sp1]